MSQEGVSHAVAEWFLFLWGDCQLAMEGDSYQPNRRAVAERIRLVAAQIQQLPAVQREAFLKSHPRSVLGRVEEFPIPSSGAEAYASGGPRDPHRPSDDPPPMAFVFLQVEHCLSSFPEKTRPLFRSLAMHLYAHRRHGSTFKHPLLDAGKNPDWAVRSLRVRILTRLAAQIAARDSSEFSLSDSAVREARRRLRSERARGRKL